MSGTGAQDGPDHLTNTFDVLDLSEEARECSFNAPPYPSTVIAASASLIGTKPLLCGGAYSGKSKISTKVFSWAHPLSLS